MDVFKQWLVIAGFTIAISIALCMVLAAIGQAGGQEDFESWLAEDQTDRQRLFSPVGPCMLYSDALLQNASKAGFEVYLATIDYPDARGHAVAALKIEGGFALYEPQDDRDVSDLHRDESITVCISGYQVVEGSTVRILSPWLTGSLDNLESFDVTLLY